MVGDVCKVPTPGACPDLVRASTYVAVVSPTSYELTLIFRGGFVKVTGSLRNTAGKARRASANVPRKATASTKKSTSSTSKKVSGRKEAGMQTVKVPSTRHLRSSSRV